MTIEIHQPELEALLMARMKAGSFQTVEEVIMQALKLHRRLRDKGVKTAQVPT